ncbi:MAG: patatin-like phospholipase family protein [Polaromonas sp.]|nr:patatin-like phospholipase family protein [Polaromonas sp.]MBP6141964.1 patatin-like phospholipase family protein [Polaromonas sp.]MBP6155797.1 patatin-like phospholipase family protein [Polaromonas sp.]MBP7114782.1 patatin-like phospholipase family protein [Polaromonas sp.]MBP7308147.1 patatin-like phospholipase family protein [Polaromonas sp.]
MTSFLAPVMAQTSRPKTALVLGAGSARGFAHIGVIKAIEAAGIKPDLIVGASAGSVIGVFYAAGYTGQQMEDIAMKVRDADVIDQSNNSKRGLIAGAALQKLINTFVKDKPIESLKIPFIAIATNLKNGEAIQLKTGDTGQAVRASSSMPGIFLPTSINGTELVDGAISSPLPVAVARQMGAEVVIAVDVGSAPQNPNAAGIYEIIMQSFEIMGQAIAKLEGQKADVLIKPNVGAYSGSDFGNRAQLIAAGLTAGQRAVEQIRLAQNSVKKRK